MGQAFNMGPGYPRGPRPQRRNNAVPWLAGVIGLLVLVVAVLGVLLLRKQASPAAPQPAALQLSPRSAQPLQTGARSPFEAPSPASGNPAPAQWRPAVSPLTLPASPQAPAAQPHATPTAATPGMPSGGYATAPPAQTQPLQYQTQPAQTQQLQQAQAQISTLQSQIGQADKDGDSWNDRGDVLRIRAHAAPDAATRLELLQQVKQCYSQSMNSYNIRDQLEFQLAQVYLQTGERALAIEQLQAVAKSQTGANPLGEQARQQLVQLGAR